MTAYDVCEEIKSRFADMEEALRKLSTAELKDISNCLSALEEAVDSIKHPFHLLERKLEHMVDEEEDEVYKNQAKQWEEDYWNLQEKFLLYVSQFGECRPCDGTGLTPDRRFSCPFCAGSGRVDIPEPTEVSTE